MVIQAEDWAVRLLVPLVARVLIQTMVADGLDAESAV